MDTSERRPIPVAETSMPFDRQPILKGALVELRPLRADDFDALFAVASDPAIWEQHPDRHRYRDDRFRLFFEEAMESGGALLARDAASGRVIGSSRFHGYDPVTSEVEIGWSFLARDLWGGRYNGEMKQLMLDHAFQFVDRVVFLIGPQNIRSQRAVERIGGVRAGTRVRGDGRDAVVYEMTAAAWRSRP
jgi:RimJ/RimL family protein N-acetyltransferase